MTILATDIEGSVRRWEAFPQSMGAVIVSHESLLKREIDRRGGFVFKTSGDGLFAAFSESSAAIESAVAAQRVLLQADFAAVDGLPVRMAIYTGDVEIVEGDYLGPAINRCSRLLSLASGGQILVGAAATESARGSLLPEVRIDALGRHKMRDVPNPEAIYQAAAPGLKETFPPLRSGSATTHNLPAQLTSFVARPTCSSAVRHRLDNHRLVTLVGSGGIGKTRMAVEVATSCLYDGIGGKPFDEIWCVELQSLSDPLLLAQIVCCAMGIEIPVQKSSIDAVVAYLKGKRALLLIDNCEHVIGACGDFITRVLRSCPHVSVLATSRERLAVTGECCFTVHGLELPRDGDCVGVDEALRYEAVRLFAERASVIEDFVLSEVNIDTVCSICRELEGVPIAIELAVPHLRMMRVEDLRERLRTQILGVRTDRAGVPRHRTLCALFDWSYDLLDHEEQAVFCRLSVFAGSWSLASAMAIAGSVVGESSDFLDVLTSLVDKSLVMMVGGSWPTPRYRFLQSVRQYAACKSRESGAETCHRQLAVYLNTLFADADRRWPTTATEEWLGAYRPELENLRAALDWAFDRDGDVELASELTGYAFRLWDELSLFEERRRYQAAAMGRAPSGTNPAIMARIWMASVADSHYGDRTNLEPAISAAALFREAGHQLGEGEALVKAGAAVLTPDTTAEAAAYLEKADAVLQPLGTTKPLGTLLRSKAKIRHLSGDIDGARALIARSEGIARALMDDLGLVSVQIAAAELAFARNEPEQAVLVTKSLLTDGRCNRRQRVLARANLAGYELALDRIDDAEGTAMTSLAEARSLIWPAAVTRAAEHMALALALRGRIEIAANLLGFGDAFYRGETAVREWTERSTSERLRTLLEDSLPIQELVSAMSIGAAWDVDRVAAAVMSAR